VDTPESTTSVERFGKEASEYTSKTLAPGTEVLLERDAEERDRYGRLLAYVWLSEPTELTDAEIRAKMFNAKLALDGFAQQLTIPPNVAYADYFTDYVASARSAELGLWKPEPKPAAAPKPKPKPKAKASSGPTVYITDTGEKYHSSGCQYLRKSKHLISLKSAKSSGYTPCSRCAPPQ